MSKLWLSASFCLCLLPSLVAQDSPPAGTNEGRAFAILREGTVSKDPQVRLQSVIATSMIGRNSLVLSRLEEALVDKDVPVRIAAANALGDFRAPETAPALRKALHDDDVPEVGLAAARALYAMKDPGGKTALIEIFNRKISGHSNALRKQARDFLGKLHTVKSAVTAIFTEGVGFVPVPGAGAGFSAVTELLTDPELSTRAGVVLLLGKSRDKETTELLRRALYDKEWSVRAAATQSIAQSARTELRSALVPLFDDSKDKVRFRAAGAYLRLTAKQSKS